MIPLACSHSDWDECTVGHGIGGRAVAAEQGVCSAALAPLHLHVGDVLGRHQPGPGEINYQNVFRAVAATGFTGFLGLEMWPTVDHTQAASESISLLAEATADPRARGPASSAAHEATATYTVGHGYSSTFRGDLSRRA